MSVNDSAVRSVALVLVLVTSLVAGPASAGHAAQTQSGAAPDAPSAENVSAAIAESRSYILTSPSYTGTHWESSPSLGVDGERDIQATMIHALTLQHLGTHNESKRDAISYLLSRRRPGGGWNDTATNYGMVLLLREVDSQAYAEEIEAIEAEIERRNGTLVPDERATSTLDMRFQTRLYYLVMSDAHDAEDLFPRGRHRDVARLQYATSAFDDDGLDPRNNTVYENSVGTTLSTSVLVASRNESLNESAAAEVLLARRFRNGAWQGGFTNDLAALALTEAGYDADDPEVQTALDWVSTELQTESGRVQFTRLDVWDTAWAVRALHASGVSTDNETLRRSAVWLQAARVTTVPRGDPELARPPLQFRAHGGQGWGYRSNGIAEWDDTALASTALRPFGPNIADDQVAFLDRVQHRSGGWTSYYESYEPLAPAAERRVRAELTDRQYAALFEAHPAPDVTGYVLEAYGRHGRTVDNDASTRRAVAFLYRTQGRDGMWQGQWGERHVYGTSRVLVGLDAVDADMSRPEVQRAVDALLARQNDDGGWGERSPASPDPTVDMPYRSAPSTPEQTAWAIRGLLAAGVDPEHPAIQRAVAYLLDTQRADGSWETHRLFGNPAYFGDNETRYSVSAVSQASVLLALSAYADARGIDTAPDGPTQSQSVPRPVVAVTLAGACLTLTALRTRRRDR